MKNPLVVGYKGEIGRFLLNELLNYCPKASNVYCVDVSNTEKEIIERIKFADVIFLCVPIQETIPWVSKYKKHLKSKVIVENTSLKSVLLNSEGKLKDCFKDINLISIHYLFKPSATPNFADKKCAIIFDELYRNLSVINFISRTVNVVHWFKNYAEHDIAMAIEQALVHRVLLTLEKHLDVSPSLYGKPVHTYLGSKIKELMMRLKTTDLKLFNIIQNNNYFPTVLEKFKKDLDIFPKW